MAVKLRLYSRPGCHLCDEMMKELDILLRTATADVFTVEVLDIEQDPETLRCYKTRIPVLAVEASGQILCESRFHRQSVLDYLSSIIQ